MKTIRPSKPGAIMKRHHPIRCSLEEIQRERRGGCNCHGAEAASWSAGDYLRWREGNKLP